MQTEHPARIGDFTVIRRLGAGGMGRVFLGATPGGRLVAIKLVRPEYADDEHFRRRFAREVDAAKKVGGFHTAQVLAADLDANPPWMALAYIPGSSLADAVQSQGPLDSARMLVLGGALAEGLSAIHSCGLIHRDLKPGNVILADDGPRIVDFGLAYDETATMITVPGSVMGTPLYMSPEQHKGLRVTAATDVFSLGAVLVFAATGHGPFDALSRGEIRERVLVGQPDLTGLSGPLRDIIVRCLEKRPEDRPAVAEILQYFTRQAPGRTKDQDKRKAGGADPVSRWRDTSTLSASHRPSRQRTAFSVDFAPDAQPLEEFSGNPGTSSMAFSGNGRYLAAVVKGKMHVWETGTSRRIATPPSASSAGSARMTFSPDERFLVFSADGKGVSRWNLAGAPPGLPSVGFYKGEEQPTISPDGQLVAFRRGKQVLLMGTEPGSAGAKVVRKGLDARFSEFATRGHPTFSSDSRRIAVSVQGDVFVYDTATLREVSRPLRDPNRFVRGIYFSPDGRFISTWTNILSRGDRITLWDIAGKQPSAWVIESDIELGHSTNVRFSADGRVVALVDSGETGMFKPTVRFWDTSTHEQLGKITPSMGFGDLTGGDFAFLPEGRRLAFVAGGKIQLQALGPSGRALPVWEDPGGSIGCAVFAPDWRLMATYSTRGKASFIRLWRSAVA